MNLDKSQAYNNICIAGLGGVGGYYGGMIALNITTNYRDKRTVNFIARGEHLDAVKKGGLILKPWGGDPVKCVPNVVTDKVTDLAPLNLLIVAVKSYDLEAFITSVKDKITASTVIIPLMNGVDNAERIRKITNRGIILPTSVYISSKIEEPGVVAMMGSLSRIISGPDPENPDYESSEMINFFRSMGIKFIWDENPYGAIWKKYIFIAPSALLTAASGKTINGVISDPRLKEDFKGIMKEIRAIAVKKGIDMPEDSEEASVKVAENIDPEAKTSFQLDVEKGKRNTEIDALGYNIVRMGKETGIPTPVTEKVLLEIKL